MSGAVKQYFSSPYPALAWTIIVGILCCLPGSLLPSETHFKIPQFDKLVHLTMFGGFVFLWNRYEARRAAEMKKLLRLFFLWYVLGNIYGVATELAQKYWIPGRDYDEADIIADMIGAGLAYGLSNLLLLKNRPAQKNQTPV